MVNPGIFREYDIRGLVDKDLTDETVRLIGKGFAAYFVKNNCKAVTLGRDVRLSGNRFNAIIEDELLNAGLDVFQIGEVTTPVAYFSTFSLPVDGGVMVTASHNPSDYNGFKISLGSTTIYGSQIQDVLKLIQHKDFVSGSRGTLTHYDIYPGYFNDLKSRTRLKKPIKVVIDSANATGGLVAPKFYNDIGAEVIELYSEPDGTFPNHHPDPTVDKYLVDLIAKVKETGADLGIGFDGDSDRIGVVDDKGRVVRGDILLAILARDILTRHPGADIVFDVKCSLALIEDIKKHGGNPVMWKTGHSLIKSKMKEINGLIAGEMSGHLFIAENYYGYDDAIFDGARLMQYLSTMDDKLSDIHDTFPVYSSTPETRLETPSDDIKFEMVRQAVEYFKANYNVIDIDGARIVFEDGWGLVRASNTQPVIVVRFEAYTPERRDEIQELVLGKLREFGEFKSSDGH